MAYTRAVILRAQERLDRARREHEAEQEARHEAIYTKNPRLREIDRTLRGTAARAVAVAFHSGQDPTEAIANLKQENLSLQREREWLLDGMGLEADSLDVSPLCAHCGGTGYIGAEMCDCLKELCRQEQRKDLSYLLNAGPDRFEAFRLDCYSREFDQRCGDSPYNHMKRVLNRCQQYAAEFSRQSGSLLFSGDTGLGKTFLSACIARKVAESGWSVIYDTAVNVFGEFETAKFGAATDENRSRTEKYLACDLLILDDLGTEMTTQFVISALYTIINTRLMRSGPTIISTNLTLEEISGRYSAPVFSRIRGEYGYCPFYGQDNRCRARQG